MPRPLDVLKTIFIPKSGESPGLFQASATIITLSTIYLYFAGYVYCYFYYSRYFQVPLEALDASPQFYWNRAFTALDNLFGGALICLVVLTVFGYLGKKIPMWATVLVMIGAFPAVYQISRYEAMIGALLTVCHPPNAVRLHFKAENVTSPDARTKLAQPPGIPNLAAHPLPNESNHAIAGASVALPKMPNINELLGLGPDISAPGDLAGLGEKNELVLLLQTKDRLIILRAPGCDTSDPPHLKKAVHAYQLSRDSVDLINLTLK